MKPFEIQVDKEIVLRSLQEKDAETLFNSVNKNRIHLRKWLAWLDLNTNLNDSLTFILECQKKLEKGVGMNLGIYFKEVFIGSVSFITINKSTHKGEVGYWLDQEYEGKGMITKSCEAIVNHGFSKLNLNRITIICATENKKSRSIPERLGFKLEGIMEEDGWLYNHFVDHAHYAMLKKNWN